MSTYIALVRKEKGSSFGVEFPDFPGCISAGDSLDEAVANAKEALEFHVRGMIEDGDKIPNPSDLNLIMSKPSFKNAVPVLIDVPVVHKNKRVNITIDEGLLAKIDELAAEMGMTRSGFIAVAARKSLLESRKDKI
ncbi:MAG: CopG family transcriptional regulator [Deltaproteobacteria bacterium]|nr:MAG: CopG family transcriptional regulator [Deltaproteobacteria bacterium]